MSSTIWTADALQSELRPYRKRVYRTVEAQHLYSTMKLVDTTDEQEVLEQVLDDAKPPVPAEHKHLHYLLTTPFRYRSRYDSRFRRGTADFGIFYASESEMTSIWEVAFYRLLFYAESPETSLPSGFASYTLFSVKVNAAKALDLTSPPLDVDRERWCRLADNSPCQDLLLAARPTGVQLVRYQSVREPSGQGRNIALLDALCFDSASVQQEQTWNFHYSIAGIMAKCENPRRSITLPAEVFLADPRLEPIRGRFG